jgi:hypothetical protein
MISSTKFPRPKSWTIGDYLQFFRDKDWSIAVHNDYMKDGHRHTFYLFTHPSGIFAKGEGLGDLIALENMMTEAISRNSHLQELFELSLAPGENNKLRSK